MRETAFTGTKDGCTKAQGEGILTVFTELKALGFGQLRHGVCMGADDVAHTTGRVIGFRIVGHPGVNQYGKCPSRGFAINDLDEVMPEEPFLVRDDKMVKLTEALVAAPHGPEERRSGTWTTVRYARKAGRPIAIVWPDGTITKENWDGLGRG